MRLMQPLQKQRPVISSPTLIPSRRGPPPGYLPVPLSSPEDVILLFEWSLWSIQGMEAYFTLDRGLDLRAMGFHLVHARPPPGRTMPAGKCTYSDLLKEIAFVIYVGDPLVQDAIFFALGVVCHRISGTMCIGWCRLILPVCS
jgi:hypothetical protein